MGDCIDQETSYCETFLSTFRQGIQQSVTGLNRPLCNDKDFNNLYNTGSPCAQDYYFLPMPNQTPYDQLLMSRLSLQKLLIENSITFYINRPKVNTLPFTEEIDASDILILNRSEWNNDDD